jgi:hypothetical protein
MKKPFLRVERTTRPPAGEPRYRWLLPLLIAVAAAVLVVIIVYSLSLGVFFG